MIEEIIALVTEDDYFRDAAVDAKNTAEIKLARNRVEMMQVCVHTQSFVQINQFTTFPAN